MVFHSRSPGLVAGAIEERRGRLLRRVFGIAPVSPLLWDEVKGKCLEVNREKERAFRECCWRCFAWRRNLRASSGLRCHAPCGGGHLGAAKGSQRGRSGSSPSRGA